LGVVWANEGPGPIGAVIKAVIVLAI